MSDWNDERLARAVLSQVCEPGDLRLTRLISGHDAADALAALRRSGHDSAWARRARTADESALVDRAERLRLRYLMPSDAEWPAGLADLDRCEEIGGMGGAPLGLWVLGTPRLDRWLGNGVAIVGARAATRYGEVVATELAGQSAGRYDYTVVPAVPMASMRRHTSARRSVDAQSGSTRAACTSHTPDRTRDCSRDSRPSNWSSRKSRPACHPPGPASWPATA